MFIIKRYYIVTKAKEVTPLKSDKPSVLACVTGQFDCDRIIKTAKEIADDCGGELRVLSVLKPTNDYSNISEQIEYLYIVAKKSGADMTVLFDSNAAKAAARFAQENNVQRIVTGMHGGKRGSFIIDFNRLRPATPISMISKDGRVYSLELCPCYSRV